FVAVDYALPELGPALRGRALWAAGVRTLQKLAERGLWAHGCADSLGEEEVRRLLSSRALALMLSPGSEELHLLSHTQSGGIPCYERRLLERAHWPQG